MQKEWLRGKIIRAIHRLDYLDLQKLSTLIGDLESMKVQGEDGKVRSMRIDRGIPMFTAKCRTVRDSTGFYLTFFCGICGNGYTTPPLVCDTLKEALHLGEQDARLRFNRCHGCHKWVCDSCYNEDEGFCNNCGASMTQPTVSKCPGCGEDNPPGTKFCCSCGTKL